MKHNKFFANILISFSFITIFSMVTVQSASAATETTKATTAAKVTETKKAVETATEKATVGGSKIKVFAVNIFNKVDTWRKGQDVTWRALKNEKEEEIKARDDKMDQGLKDREEAVLAGEQASLVNNSVKDFDWHILLLKFYVALLTVFVWIFTYPIVFYAVIIVVAFVIIRKLYQRIRYGY